MLLSQTASWYITVCTYIWAIPPNYLIWLVYGQTYTEHYRITYQRNPPSTVNKRVWLYSTFTPKIGLIQGWFVLARGQYVQRQRANLSFSYTAHYCFLGKPFILYVYFPVWKFTPGLPTLPCFVGIFAALYHVLPISQTAKGYFRSQ